jgi:hypothetical protein
MFERSKVLRAAAHSLARRAVIFVYRRCRSRPASIEASLTEKLEKARVSKNPVCSKTMASSDALSSSRKPLPGKGFSSVRIIRRGRAVGE